MISNENSLEKIIIPTPFHVGPVNVYLIKGERLTLVDTGPKTAEAKEALKNSLNNLGYSFSEIEQIVLTHHHPDHVGLIEEFPKAIIIGHKKCNPWLLKDTSFFVAMKKFFTSFFNMHNVPSDLIEKMVMQNHHFQSFSGTRGLDKEVAEGDRIDGLSGWQVIETPGHAQSQISLFHENNGILLGGDHIIAHISSNAILEHPYSNDEKRPLTLLQYRNSLKKCLQLPIKKVYSGHGQIVEEIETLVTNRFLEHEEKMLRLKNLIPETGISSFELCKQYYPHVYQKEPMLTMSEIIGHLDLLIDREEIKVIESEGLILYGK